MERQLEDEVAQARSTSLPSFPVHRNAAYNELRVEDATGVAITALITGICGLAGLGIRFGITALRRIRAGGGHQPLNKAMAIAGIVFGSFWLVVIAVLLWVRYTM